MTDTPTVTPENAEEVRAQLAALEAEQAEEARQTENASRAEKREGLQPLTDILTGPSIDPAALKDAVSALPPDEWDLANLARNACTVLEALMKRHERRLADLQPSPEPA